MRASRVLFSSAKGRNTASTKPEAGIYRQTPRQTTTPAPHQEDEVTWHEARYPMIRTALQTCPDLLTATRGMFLIPMIHSLGNPNGSPVHAPPLFPIAQQEKPVF
ncbi:hypothetical protein LHGZ1_2658 [Laribacter hongkongensis]|uniref:Uncharacterized protein n=1 Tax=Laribacter hongkongensis TaxID=168471 RepID=A0A248LLW1_9NEIS|nr:hypothetical protein LHGZ1_2658 [Laribacter hongkongensis]